MKICFKCKVEKSIGSFYIHKGMKDGRLNKCIDCAKKDSNNRLNDKIKDPVWIKKERERQSIKNKKTWKQKTSRYRDKYPEKYAALLKSQRMKTKVKGNHKHHWSYNKEHYEDFIELSEKDHLTIHRFTIYDQERMMYRISNDGVLLDTKIMTVGFMNALGITPF